MCGKIWTGSAFGGCRGRTQVHYSALKCTFCSILLIFYIVRVCIVLSSGYLLRCPVCQVPQYVDAYMAGRPPLVDSFVTFTMPSTEVNEAFHVMHEGMRVGGTFEQ